MAATGWWVRRNAERRHGGDVRDGDDRPVATDGTLSSDGMLIVWDVSPAASVALAGGRPVDCRRAGVVPGELVVVLTRRSSGPGDAVPACNGRGLPRRSSTHDGGGRRRGRDGEPRGARYWAAGGGQPRPPLGRGHLRPWRRSSTRRPARRRRSAAPGRCPGQRRGPAPGRAVGVVRGVDRRLAAFLVCTGRAVDSAPKEPLVVVESELGVDQRTRTPCGRRPRRPRPAAMEAGTSRWARGWWLALDARTSGLGVDEVVDRGTWPGRRPRTTSSQDGELLAMPGRAGAVRGGRGHRGQSRGRPPRLNSPAADRWLPDDRTVALGVRLDALAVRPRARAVTRPPVSSVGDSPRRRRPPGAGIDDQVIARSGGDTP